MAGFKQTVITHEPSLFLTFDGDVYDPNLRTLVATPKLFMDESGKGNDGILHEDDSGFPVYRMGIPSLVDLEPTDQRAISFGWYGHQSGYAARWPKGFIEVSHTADFAFNQPDNHGSFTVGMMIEKMSDEANWRDVEYNATPRGNYTATLDRTWIRKAAVFHLYYRDHWSSNDQIVIEGPDGIRMTMDNVSNSHWFMRRRNFIVFCWDVKELEEGFFEGTATFYVNGYPEAKVVRSYRDTVPNTNITSPIEIAGTINPGGTGNNDTQTSDTRFDQIFILPKAINPDEVARLYRKVRTYDQLIYNSRPLVYCPMSDAENTVNWTMEDMMGSFAGEYIGGTNRVIRQQQGPPLLLGNPSVAFQLGGHAAVRRHYSGSNGYGYTPINNLTGDFTIHFWFAGANSHRSILAAMQMDEFPFQGFNIELNRRDNSNVPGSVFFGTSDGYFTQSNRLTDNGDSWFFNDNRWHSVFAIRRGTILELWIDGRLHETTNAPIFPLSHPGPGQIYLMGNMPGNLNTDGYMSNFGLWTYALMPHEIRMYAHYSQIYRIRGNVTLQGNPHMANVRAMEHRSGKLITEVLSDNNTGDYMIDLYDNRLIDLVVLNKQDRNIRYRAYGPITPSYYPDLPN